MAGYNGVKRNTIGWDMLDVPTQSRIKNGGVILSGSGTAGNGGGGSSAVPVAMQWGIATIVNGVGFIKVTSGNQGALVISASSYVGGIAITAYDSGDVPTIVITNITYGSPASGTPASITFSTKKDVGVTFNFLVVG